VCQLRCANAIVAFLGELAPGVHGLAQPTLISVGGSRGVVLAMDEVARFGVPALGAGTGYGAGAYAAVITARTPCTCGQPPERRLRAGRILEPRPINEHRVGEHVIHGPVLPAVHLEVVVVITRRG
jgi:hypothetical protein